MIMVDGLKTSFEKEILFFLYLILVKSSNKLKDK